MDLSKGEAVILEIVGIAYECVNSRSVRFAQQSRSFLGTALSRTKLPW